MSAIVREVLGVNKNISDNTSGYIDDIFVNTSNVSVEEVAWHLARYGLECKPAEKVWEETRVLGLKVGGAEEGVALETGQFCFSTRNND